MQQLEKGASLSAGHHATPQAFKPTMNKEESKKMHTRDPHTSIHTKVHNTFSWKQTMGTEPWLFPCLLPARVGHLINVTQHPILLHCVFLHSVPVGSPEAHFHCKLLVSGKLSKAFDWRRGRETSSRAPTRSVPSSSDFSLVLYSTSPHTQIMLWKSFTVCHLRIKKKKRKKECSVRVSAIAQRE